ncbi:hypothetical protein G6F40_014280 [Rhizopus arrhizus]|nr:hypothetical protein G6F24_015143 [Rhizopus arrhizus]KAG0929261.1 hypothetical protein G6F31_017417 [Rhizopus arrhizus]KAG1085126.1 hypothetical protein G6F40_014280 [Rhizopus arrhizus]
MSNRSPKDIAGEFGIHPKTVRRYRNKLFGPMVPATRGALKIAKNVHRMLMRFGYSMPYRSAINVLVSISFYARRKKRQPLLTYNHRKQRLAWAKKYQNWSIQQWHQVVFSDETKINIWGSDGCRYYWTQPGDVLRPHHINLSVKHGSGKSIMWGCITSEGSGYACQVYDGTMDSLVYQHILGTTYMETLKYYGTVPVLSRKNKKDYKIQRDLKSYIFI